jgi:hypothetical protein
MTEVKEITTAYVVESSLFQLPSALAWLQAFDAEERGEFLQEVLASLAAATTTGRWNQIAEVLDAWKETAYERADPDLQARLEAARRELAEGEAHSWETVKEELAL